LIEVLVETIVQMYIYMHLKDHLETYSSIFRNTCVTLYHKSGNCRVHLLYRYNTMCTSSIVLCTYL